MTQVVVVREHSVLGRETWRFLYFDREHTLRLCSHNVEQRPSTRHRFRVTSSYTAHTRGVVVPCVPPDVASEARNKFVSNLTVTTWPEKSA